MQNEDWELSDEQQKSLQVDLLEIQQIAKWKRDGKKLKTHEDVREYRAERYREHFQSYDKEVIKITHLDDADTILETVFLDCTCPRIKIENVEKKNRPKNIDSGLIKLDNLSELAQKYYHLFDGEVVLKKPKGIEEVKVKITPFVDFHAYQKYLKAIVVQFKACNPKLSLQGLNDWLVHMYTECVSIPRIVEDLRKEQYNIIESIANDVYHKSYEPKTFPVKFLWNPDYDLTAQEKTQIINEINGKERRSGTLAILKSHYEEGISKNELIRRSGVSKPKVYEYWDKFAS